MKNMKNIIATMAIAAVAGSANAAIIYDNTTTPLPNLFGQNLATSWGGNAHVGDELSLAGTERFVTELQLQYFGLGPAFVTRADFEIKIWIVDPVLFTLTQVDSKIFNDVAVVQGQGTYNFTGLTADLGSSTNLMAYTAKISDILPTGVTDPFGPRMYDPPTVGSSTNDFISDQGTNTYTYFWFGGIPVANFGAKVTAINGIRISGNIVFSDLSVSAPTVRQATVRVLDATTNALLDSRVVTTDANGDYTFISVASGDVRIMIDAAHFLKKEATASVMLNTPITGVNAVLINGDIDDDNFIGLDDFNLLSTSFNLSDTDPGFISGADLDEDLFVGLDDFNILSSNFNTAGDDE